MKLGRTPQLEKKSRGASGNRRISDTKIPYLWGIGGGGRDCERGAVGGPLNSKFIKMASRVEESVACWGKPLRRGGGKGGVV